MYYKKAIGEKLLPKFAWAKPDFKYHLSVGQPNEDIV